MITREQVHIYVDDPQTVDIIMSLIEQEREQYQALVDAVSHTHKIQLEPPDVEKAMLALAAVFKAHRELMEPPPSIPDRLDALANFLEAEGLLSQSEYTRAITAELREKHCVD